MRITAQHRHLHRADQRRVDLEGQGGPGQVRQPVGDLADGDVTARADVVDPSGPTRPDEEAVGADHVADVGEVAAGRQIAHRDGAGPAPLGLHDPPGQCRHGELGGLARADVVERADGDHVLAVPQKRLGHQGLGGQFAGGVGREWCRGRRLGEGQL